MATHKSAVKRHRQSEKRAQRNQLVRSRLRTAVRHVRRALASRDGADATVRLRVAERLLRKAVTKGVLQRNSASRRISRLSRQLHALGTP